MRGASWWLVVYVALPLLVFGLGLTSFNTAAQRVSLHVDEIQYVWRSRYFWYLFVERDVGRAEWDDRLETHTHPMLANYLVGASLWLHGHSRETLPDRFRPGRGLEANRRDGRVPDQAMLLQARQPMVVLAAGAAALIYLLGALLGGPLAGLAAAALALVSPVLRTHLVRAASEAPFAFFLLLALLLGMLGLRRGQQGALPARWAVALGVALGLALASKLTAGLSLVAALGWGAAVSLAAVARDRTEPRRALERAWAVGRGWPLAGLVALAVFTVSNPHLYPDPVLHIGHLLEHRVERMELQQRIDEVAIHAPLEGAWFVARGSLRSGTGLAVRRRPLETGLALAGEAFLALSGLAALAAVCYRCWRGSSQLRPEGLVLLTTATYFVGLAGAIHVSWDRYLVPTSALVAVLSGVGLGAWLHQLRRLGAWRSVPAVFAPNRR